MHYIKLKKGVCVLSSVIDTDSDFSGGKYFHIVKNIDFFGGKTSWLFYIPGATSMFFKHEATIYLIGIKCRLLSQGIEITVQ